MNKNKIQRNNSIDLLRVMACLAVVFIHISTAPVGSAQVAISAQTLKNMELIHILMQWSVPVFFMITGFCIIQKESCTYSYCFAKVFKYIVTLFTVGLFYALLEGVYFEKSINLKIVIDAFKCVISGYTWEHMWFVYSIIGIYLVLPIVHCFMRQGNKNIVIITSILLFFNIIIPAISKYIAIGFELPFNGYLVYICFGGMIAKCKINKMWKYLSICTIVTSILYMYINVGKELFLFKHPIVCVMAMGIFVLVSQTDLKAFQVIGEIAKYSWGIYLIHPFFMNLGLKIFKIDLFSGMIYLKLFLFAIAIFVISLIITYVLRKVPVIKTIF